MDNNQNENPKEDLKQDEGTGKEVQSGTVGEAIKEVINTELEKDNGNEEPLDEKEMNTMSKDRDKSEKEFKFVIIGGNEPSVNESFVKSIESANIPITVFELTLDEMKFIINSRAQKKAEESAVDYLKDDENKKRINDWVKILIQNHLKRNYKGEQLNEFIKSAYDGEFEVRFDKKSLKQASTLSWSQFNELFGNLELFGVVKYEDDNVNYFSLILDTSDILKNQFVELKQFANITLGKVVNLQKETKLDSKQKKKLESIKKTLSSVIEKI